ncbi:MAG: 30S ribosomal protein S7 [Candidatus Paceibacterota bacterium]
MKKYKEIDPDPKYNSISVAKFVNKLMKGGEKSVARKLMYKAFEQIKDKKNQDPSEVLEEAISNVTPQLEVKSMRIGGATYQVPKKVGAKRGKKLAMRWLVEAARSGSAQNMQDNLAEEIMAASEKEGGAYKKKQDEHRMAEANKAFAHFAR